MSSLLTLLAPRLPFDCVTKPVAALVLFAVSAARVVVGVITRLPARLARGKTSTAAMTDKRMRRVAFKDEPLTRST